MDLYSDFGVNDPFYIMVTTDDILPAGRASILLPTVSYSASHKEREK